MLRSTLTALRVCASTHDNRVKQSNHLRRKGDVYVHAELHGASTTIIKNQQPDQPIPPLTISQARAGLTRMSASNVQPHPCKGLSACSASLYKHCSET